MKICWFLFIVLIFKLSLIDQSEEINYEESKVPQYTLPDPLICSDGTKVRDKTIWIRGVNSQKYATVKFPGYGYYWLSYSQW